MARMTVVCGLSARYTAGARMEASEGKVGGGRHPPVHVLSGVGFSSSIPVYACEGWCGFGCTALNEGLGSHSGYFLLCSDEHLGENETGLRAEQALV